MDPRIPHRQNPETSWHFHVYPDASEEVDLAADGPGAEKHQKRLPRRIIIMGAIAEGSTEVLCVERSDGVGVPIPVPWLAVGMPLGGDAGITAQKLLPYTVTGVIASAEGPTLTLSGTPDEQRDFTITITDPGDGEDPDSVVFTWAATGSGAEGEAGVSPTAGAYVLGGTGITITFDTPTLDPEFIYTDNSTFEFAAFVSTVANIMVLW